MIYDQRETLRPGDDPVHYLHRDADHHRGAQRPIVPHDGEQTEKGASALGGKRTILLI